MTVRSLATPTNHNNAQLKDIKMSGFEEWFLEVIGIMDEKMAITIDVFDSADWFASYKLDLTPMQAVKDRYGLT